MIQTYLFSFIVAIIISLFTLKILINISEKHEIFDNPNGRKNHSKKISFLGGIGVFTSLFITYGIFYPVYIQKPNYTHGINMLMYLFLILGVGDDFLNFNAKKKFIYQFIFISIYLLISKDTIDINRFTQITIPFNNIFNLIFSVLLMVFLVNSINLIDGLDGLAASISIIIITFYCIYFISTNDIYFAMLSFTTNGALIGFLIKNKPPAKIFLGNGGSQFIGILLCILSFHFLKYNGKESDIIYLNDLNSIKIFSGLFALPVLDSLRVMILRITKSKNPFVGDNNHIHHIIQNIGFNKKQTLTILFIFHLILISISMINFSINLFIITAIILSVTYSLIIIGLMILQKFKKKYYTIIIKEQDFQNIKIEEINHFN